MNKNKILEVMRYLTLHTDHMTDVKLMKMMYLSDKQSLLQSGYPITEDSYFCMNRGPILSTSLNLINNSDNNFLQYFSAPTEQNNPEDSVFSSVRSIELYANTVELLEISEYEKDILDDTIRKYAHMSTDTIVSYSHDSLPEWDHPQGSSTPITYEDILIQGEIPHSLIPELVSEINYFKSL